MLCSRAHVIVEDVDTALREAGDVVLAIDEGHLTGADLIPLRQIATDPGSLRFDRPVLVKTTGMAWQDLVAATAVQQRLER